MSEYFQESPFKYIPFVLDGPGLVALIISFVLLLLMVFGALFAVNSSLHSYLIVSYAKEDGVSLDVGFYYIRTL